MLCQSRICLTLGLDSPGVGGNKEGHDFGVLVMVITNNLHIWQDPWVSRGVFRRPITPRGACLLTYVSELINPSFGDWDVDLVKEIFWEEDVKVILALPVHEGRDNLIAWHYDNHGRFSVKSAYKVCRADLSHERSQGGHKVALVMHLILFGKQSGS